MLIYVFFLQNEIDNESNIDISEIKKIDDELSISEDELKKGNNIIHFTK